MNQVTIVETASDSNLPTLLDRAASALASARTSGEVLEARDLAAAVYDAAKSAGRMARVKQAHDDVIGAVYRAQADAALIEARAKIRLADEYDAAQGRGEVAKIGDNLPSVTEGNSKPTAADIGLSRKEIHEARVLRDAEKAQPGVIGKAVADRVEAGQEPTKAAIKKAAHEATGRKPAQQKRTIEQPAALPESDELAEARHTITELAAENERLNDMLAVNSADLSEEGKAMAAETIAQLRQRVHVLEQENDALRASRDSYMTENGEMKKQIAYWRKRAEKVAA